MPNGSSAAAAHSMVPQAVVSDDRWASRLPLSAAQAYRNAPNSTATCASVSLADAAQGIHANHQHYTDQSSATPIVLRDVLALPLPAAVPRRRDHSAITMPISNTNSGEVELSTPAVPTGRVLLTHASTSHAGLLLAVTARTAGASHAHRAAGARCAGA